MRKTYVYYYVGIDEVPDGEIYSSLTTETPPQDSQYKIAFDDEVPDVEKCQVDVSSVFYDEEARVFRGELITIR